MRFLRPALILPAVFLLALAGCRPEDVIQKETVTIVDREWLRLRVAILERGDLVCFIRLDGPEEQVAQHQAALDEFVKSTIFTGKKDEPVKWTEPKAWKKDAPSKDRYAAFRIDAKPKVLEVKISLLPAKNYSLMDNMHRWQKQLDLPLSERPEDNKQFLKDEMIGNQQVTWVSMKGLGVHTVSKPPDPNAANQKNFMGGLQLNEKGKLPFKYTAPDGWTRVDPGEFAVDAYEVAAGGAIAKVTVTPLSGAMAGNLAENVNRWRKLVKLEPMAPKDVEKAVRPIQVGGIASAYADVANPAGPPAKNRIIAVMVPLNQRTAWFIVMTGPSDLVGQNKNAFETFVESFKK